MLGEVPPPLALLGGAGSIAGVVIARSLIAAAQCSQLGRTPAWAPSMPTTTRPTSSGSIKNIPPAKEGVWLCWLAWVARDKRRRGLLRWAEVGSECLLEVGSAWDRRVNTVGRELESGQADFDFFVGDWRVHHRRLRQALAGSTEWEEFDGTSHARRVWGGRGNIDEIEADSTAWGHIAGATLRLYDPDSQQWRLYWANAANGVLEAPMIGAFDGGIGEFFSHELLQGRPIFVRYVWSGITADECRWEQAFSVDGGRTWESNWVMDFTREP